MDKDLKKTLMGRVLEAELEAHLGYRKHGPEGNNSGSSRNGYNRKMVVTEEGKVALAVPLDREGSCKRIFSGKNCDVF